MKEQEGLKEFEALKQAIKIGVKAGIYSMEDVVVLHHSLVVVGKLLDGATEEGAIKMEPENGLVE